MSCGSGPLIHRIEGGTAIAIAKHVYGEVREGRIECTLTVLVWLLEVYLPKQ